MNISPRNALAFLFLAVTLGLTLDSVNESSDSAARYDACLQSGGGDFCMGFINP